MASFVDRIVGAARLDVQTYEEVEADTTATPQAMGVVVLAALSAGVGALTSGGTGVVFGLLGALVGWAAWAAVIWFIGTKLLPEPQTSADVGQLLRTLGFAASPGLLALLRIVPLIYSKVTKWGKQMVSNQVGAGWYATGPSGGPEWQMRYMMVLLFPK